MSDIRVKDQFGNPPPANDRLSVQLTPDDWPGDPTHGPQDDRFTDNLGKTSFPGAQQLWPATGYTLKVNVVNTSPNYGTASRHVTAAELEAAPIEFVVQKTNVQQPPTNPPAGPITGNGTCEEWKAAVFAIFAKHGFTGPGPEHGNGQQAPNLRATEKEIKALHPSAYVRWQFDSSVPPNLRPRLFLPHDGTDPFARYADIGNWDGPMKWDHCQ